MIYETPKLRALGTFSGLTMGQNGSCPDGGARNNTQLGGGVVGGPGGSPCGSSSGDTGATNTSLPSDRNIKRDIVPVVW